jgi:hypothetical protein
MCCKHIGAIVCVANQSDSRAHRRYAKHIVGVHRVSLGLLAHPIALQTHYTNSCQAFASLFSIFSAIYPIFVWISTTAYSVYLWMYGILLGL